LKPLRMKDKQLETCGIFYCRVSAVINGSGSLQTLSATLVFLSKVCRLI